MAQDPRAPLMAGQGYAQQGGYAAPPPGPGGYAPAPAGGAPPPPVLGPDGKPIAAPTGVDPSAYYVTQAPKGTPEGGDAGPWRDVIFAVLWIAQLIGIIVLAFTLGLSQFKKDASSSGEPDPSNPNISIDTSHFATMIGVCSAAAMFGAILLVTVLQRFAETLITVTLQVTIALFAVGAILGFVAFQNVPVAVINGVFCLFTALYYCLIRRRIPFAAENLRIGITIVQLYPATVLAAVIMLVAQFAWIVVWSLAAYGAMYNWAGKGDVQPTPGNENPGQAPPPVMVILLVSLYWTQQVFSNIVHCTSCGTAGSWWFQGVTAVSPTWGAFKRACTTSLGSIAFGSLLVALIKTLIAIIRSAAHSKGRRNLGQIIIAACALCLLRCIENALRYFNKWGFCFVALYGRSYCEGAKDAIRLFEGRGWTTIINDDLIDGVLTIGSFIVAVLSGLIGAAFAKAQHASDATAGVYGGTAFILGLLFAFIMVTVISSCVAAVFVCFAANPEALATTHPGTRRCAARWGVQTRGAARSRHACPHACTC